MKKRNDAMRRRALAAAALLATLAGASLAQEVWPAKPIKLVVPFPPGGGTDTMARLLADKRATQARWTLVIHKHPPPRAHLGLAAVAKAVADGHTIGLGQTANLAINPALYPKMPFDPLQDFAPITSIA